ncbi:hypothetical protein QYF61_021562 [Mycteria americana]|uniref:Polymer-forming cytoskeletal protein n=1 Tax=Mycteria americana TaxID=33587 RepID=A0AAN7S1G8_MYCAM|nr:hypothetical protein QYF61_021562 [Mycteria americana]
MGTLLGSSWLIPHCPQGAIQAPHSLFQQHLRRQHNVGGWKHHGVPDGLDMEGSRMAGGDGDVTTREGAIIHGDITAWVDVTAQKVVTTWGGASIHGDITAWVDVTAQKVVITWERALIHGDITAWVDVTAQKVVITWERALIHGDITAQGDVTTWGGAIIHGDIVAWGAATAHGCPQGFGCAGQAVLCALPLEVVVAEEGRWQHCGAWGHCSPLTVVGQERLQLALGGPLVCPGQGEPAALGCPQGSAWRRSNAVDDCAGG